MKKLLFTLLAILVFAGICVATRPAKEKHSEAIIEIMNKSPKVDIKANKAVFNVIKNAINSTIEIDDCYLFNFGVLKKGDTNKKLTLGILGQVFVIDKNNSFSSKVKK